MPPPECDQMARVHAVRGEFEAAFLRRSKLRLEEISSADSELEKVERS